MNLNQQFELIPQSATVALSDRIKAMQAGGQNILGLQVGDPDFSTPQAILEVAHKAMQEGLTHYGPSRGFLDLRQAIVAKLVRDEGVTFDPHTEILVTHGGVHGYFTAMKSILNPGDDILIPDPSWATHSNMVIMMRGKVIPVPAPAENGFVPLFESWEKAVTPRTRALVINYPSNPTGAYPTTEYLQNLQNFAKEHDLWIVSDEVYGSLYYGERPTCAAALEGAKERTLVINSLSKTYAMTGWRVGFLAAPETVIENALKAGQNSITCVAPFIQKAAAFALTDPEIQETTLLMRSAYARRRELILHLAQELKSDPMRLTQPQGALYFFLDLRALKMTSIEICERILTETKVGLVPGSAFGKQGEGFVRMSLTVSDQDLEEGFRRIVQWAKNV
ncbi:MAG: pyridoxal phosphate-dependent aminotransferase [Chloroflexi bacterium]|nr:pyridoxal phosphate-dependent aminotransferase [Chloroflexota bacterium]